MLRVQSATCVQGVLSRWETTISSTHLEFLQSRNICSEIFSDLKGAPMPADDFEPKLGRIRDPKPRANLRTTKCILEHAAKSGAGPMRQRSRILPGTRRCGMAPGVHARAGLIAPGSRRVIVRGASAAVILVWPARICTTSSPMGSPASSGFALAFHEGFLGPWVRGLAPRGRARPRPLGRGAPNRKTIHAKTWGGYKLRASLRPQMDPEDCAWFDELCSH